MIALFYMFLPPQTALFYMFLPCQTALFYTFCPKLFSYNQLMIIFAANYFF